MPAARWRDRLSGSASPRPGSVTVFARAGSLVASAGAAFEKLRAEARALAPAGRETVAAYLERRAGADPLVAAFVSPALEVPGRDAGAALDDAARAAERVLGEIGPARGRGGPCTASGTPIRVFVGAKPGEEIAARVLLAGMERAAGRRLEVRFALPEIESLFGARAAALPRGVWPLLVPALCQFEGRALYVEPSALVLGDVARLWDAGMGGKHALFPSNGPASIALVDAARSPWDGEVLERTIGSGTKTAASLRPDSAAGTGALPAAWQFRDEASLAADAIRFTCEPWLPWRSDLHPAAWLWDACFDAAVISGHVVPSDVERAAADVAIRPALAARAQWLAGAMRSPALAR
jgi:hypothetical protein